MKKVERRSDGRVFESVTVAANQYGHTPPNISLAARQTERGLYATAYGEQWRYWALGNQKEWPEKADNPVKRRATVRAARKRVRTILTAHTDNFECPAGSVSECPYLELCRHLVGLLFDGINLETLKNER